MMKIDLAFPILGSVAVIGMLFVISMLVSCKSTDGGPDGALFKVGSSDYQEGYRDGMVEGVLLVKDTPQQ